MVEGVKLSKKDINELKKFISSIEGTVKRFPTLVEKLGLKKRFIGVLGEAIGLITIFKLFGSSYKYTWHSERKKDFDLELTRNNKKIKIQIKASADENYGFRPLNVRVDDVRKAVEMIRKNDLTNIFEKIDESIEGKDVDFWAFVPLTERGSIYLVNKNGLKKILKKQFRRYVDKHPNSKKNFGVSIKTNSLSFVLHKKDDEILLRKYKLKVKF